VFPFSTILLLVHHIIPNTLNDKMDNTIIFLLKPVQIVIFLHIKDKSGNTLVIWFVFSNRIFFFITSARLLPDEAIGIIIKYFNAPLGLLLASPSRSFVRDRRQLTKKL